MTTNHRPDAVRHCERSVTESAASVLAVLVFIAVVAALPDLPALIVAGAVATATYILAFLAISDERGAVARALDSGVLSLLVLPLSICASMMSLFLLFLLTI